MMALSTLPTRTSEAVRMSSPSSQYRSCQIHICHRGHLENHIPYPTVSYFMYMYKMISDNMNWCSLLRSETCIIVCMGNPSYMCCYLYCKSVLILKCINAVISKICFHFFINFITHFHWNYGRLLKMWSHHRLLWKLQGSCSCRFWGFFAKALCI